MMRATFTAVIDQVLLSALNFGIAAALIYFSSKEDYGLYAQLINLQSLFSPLHAGLFVSAFLAIGSRKHSAEYERYRASMVRAELLLTIPSAIIVALLTYLGIHLLGAEITWQAAVASAIALLGLWWREFSRQQHFATARYAAVLRIDSSYLALAIFTMAIFAIANRLSSVTMLWCLGIAGAAAASNTFLAAIKTSTTANDMVKHVAESWRIGRWDALGSFATWGYAQSYLYLAAIQGGLNLVAEMSAARLLATPLALLWASYANVLRPTASKLFAAHDLRGIRQLAIKAAAVVLALSASYALFLPMILPMLEPLLKEKGFQHIQQLAFAWSVYFAVAGISTVAASILRSALAFKEVFVFQIISCIAAVAIFAISFRFTHHASLIVGLTVVELISTTLLWRNLWHRTSNDVSATMYDARANATAEVN